MTAVVVWVGEAKTALYLAVSSKYTTYIARSGKRGLDLAHQHQAGVVIVDAHSLHTSGLRICGQIRVQRPETTCVLITAMPMPISDAVSIAADSSPRTLMTQLNRLLRLPSQRTVRCGDFLLDTTQRVLYVRQQSVALNPKQCKLLEVFFTRPNQIIERAVLMKQVWQTDYLGDTRTLDVHIRWVRAKLEGTGGLHGRYLTTIRGVGYRLDIATNQKDDSTPSF